MSFVTDEMRSFVKKVSRAAIASIKEDGSPHITIKNGRLRKDGTLELWAIFGDATTKNLERDPRICVTFTDFEESRGYRFNGKAKVLTEGERYQKVKSDLSGAGWDLQALIKVDVDEITLISQNPDEVDKKVF
ncbi:MAG: pyridoxamine 5'-phosphate oxidase family protein [Candidatus Thorarchaeota archaeon]|jgi:predicted pyridoxine 5'-phosphate oxidase superfamily flavin-nucleotide-binding protein